MSSSFFGLWLEEKGRFGGEFEAAKVFPAEGCMIQVSSRRQRVAFCRAEIAFCRVLFSSFVNKMRCRRLDESSPIF